MAQTFNGGIKIKGSKSTESAAAAPFAEPKRVAISMKQHTGAACVPTVAVGDRVDIGQCVGDTTDALGCPIHASVSGTVTAIERRTGAAGEKVTHVVIENDGLYTVTPFLDPVTSALGELTQDEIIGRVRKAGVVDTGNEAYPAHAKLLGAAGNAKRLIINCVESEPYLTVGYRLMLEQPETVIRGVKVLIYALGLRKATIAIEENKKDVIELLEKHITDKALISVKTLKPKYPQGGERQLIFALYGKEISALRQPFKEGYVILGPETALSVYKALSTGMPVIHKRVTVDGDAIKKPRSLIVPIGTSAEEIAEFCGGTKKKLERLVFGGPMAGQAQWSMESSVTKGVSALLFLSDAKVKDGACIRCGRCVQVCPMRLLPLQLAAYSEKRNYKECIKLELFSCVECGCCAYVCPGRVPIVKHIRSAKDTLNDMVREMNKQGEAKNEQTVEG